MSPNCSIIIRCYNEARHLPRLLFGISQQTMKDVEIIAVDSGSTDETPLILRRHGVKTLFLEPERFSFGRSCNLGCRAAQGEILVFVSAHAYPVYLLKPFVDPLVGICYGKQRGNSLNTYSECQLFKVWYPEQDQTIQEHPFCNNANSAVRRSVWEALGFNETLTGLEDVDLAKRAWERHQKIAYVVKAEVIHVHEEHLGAVRHRFRREALAYHRIFPHEKMSFGQFCMLYVGNVISDCRNALRDGVLRRHFQEILQFRMMQFWGAYQGMRQHGPVTNQLKRRFYYPAGLNHPQKTQKALRGDNTVQYQQLVDEN
jgi:rhamnosyltransferase